MHAYLWHYFICCMAFAFFFICIFPQLVACMHCVGFIVLIFCFFIFSFYFYKNIFVTFNIVIVYLLDHFFHFLFPSPCALSCLPLVLTPPFLDGQLVWWINKAYSQFPPPAIPPSPPVRGFDISWRLGPSLSRLLHGWWVCGTGTVGRWCVLWCRAFCYSMVGFPVQHTYPTHHHPHPLPTILSFCARIWGSHSACPPPSLLPPHLVYFYHYGTWDNGTCIKQALSFLSFFLVGLWVCFPYPFYLVLPWWVGTGLGWSQLYTYYAYFSCLLFLPPPSTNACILLSHTFSTTLCLSLFLLGQGPYFSVLLSLPANTRIILPLPPLYHTHLPACTLPTTHACPTHPPFILPVPQHLTFVYRTLPYR